MKLGIVIMSLISCKILENGPLCGLLILESFLLKS